MNFYFYPTVFYLDELASFQRLTLEPDPFLGPYKFEIIIVP